MAKPTLEDVHIEISGHLAEISKIFVKSAKITLIVRNPDQADGDVIVGDDDLDSVIAAINKLKNRGPLFQPKNRHLTIDSSFEIGGDGV